MGEKVDVCIIGGGIVGLFCALELSQAGKTVRIVDKLFTGSSRHNIGDVLFQGYDEESLPFLKMTSDAWSHASETYGVNMGFEKRGSIFLAYSDADAVQFKRDVANDNAHGFETVYYEDDVEKLRETMGVKGLPEEIIGAKISSEDYVVDTGLALDALRKLLIQNGVRFWGSDEVVDVTIENNKLISIRTNTGEECEAGHFLITAGVWASKLLKSMGVSVPMRPARCHLLEVSPSGTIPKQLLAKRFRSGDIIVKYQRSGKVLVSYTGVMDQAQATWSNAVDEEAVEWIKEQLPTMLKGLIGPIVHSVRTVTLAITQDGRPFLGQAGHLENVLVAIGFCGKSYAYSAGVGKAARAVVLGEDPGIDMSLYAVGRKIETNLGQTEEMTTILGAKPEGDADATMTVGDKPDADSEVDMATGNKPSDDPNVTMEVGDLPDGDSDVTMVLGDKPEDKDGGISMEVGELPDGDSDVTMEVDGESALKNKQDDSATFEVDGEDSALRNKKEEGSSFVSEGEDGTALGKVKESATHMAIDGDETTALGKKEANESSFVTDGDEATALGKAEEGVHMEFDEDGTTLEKPKKEQPSLVVDSEQKTALGVKKEPKKAKGKLEVDDNPYLGLGAKKKPEKKDLPVEEEAEEETAEEIAVAPAEAVEPQQDETVMAEGGAAEEGGEEAEAEEGAKPKKKESKLVYEERKPKKASSKIVYD